MPFTQRDRQLFDTVGTAGRSVRRRIPMASTSDVTVDLPPEAGHLD